HQSIYRLTIYMIIPSSSHHHKNIHSFPTRRSSDLKLIDDILEDKKAFGEEFNVNALGAYNLRKTSFSDIINDDEFVHHIIPNYISKLKSFIDQEQLLVFWLSKYDFQYRVKNSDTVFLKIKQYSEREKEKGKLQLKKSLNDLFGIRIILPGIGSVLKQAF